MLQGDANATAKSAQAVVDSICDVATTITEIKQAQNEYEAKVAEYKLKLSNARTQEEIEILQSWIDYYSTIAETLEYVADAKTTADRRTNIKRFVIFGCAISVALYLSVVAYKKSNGK